MTCAGRVHKRFFKKETPTFSSVPSAIHRRRLYSPFDLPKDTAIADYSALKTVTVYSSDSDIYLSGYFE
jgi:hypothetical protein